MRSENEVYWRDPRLSVAVAECESCFGYAGSDIDRYNHRNYVLCGAADARRGALGRADAARGAAAALAAESH